MRLQLFSACMLGNFLAGLVLVMQGMSTLKETALYSSSSAICHFVSERIVISVAMTPQWYGALLQANWESLQK